MSVPWERFAAVAGRHHGCEIIEVFGRRTAHVAATRRDGSIQTEQGTHWQILVSSHTPQASATAVTTDLSPDGLSSTLEIARLLRRTVPARPRAPRPLPPLPMKPSPYRPLDSLHKTHEAVGRTGVTTTVTHSTASVWLVDSTGRAGCYATAEAQLAIRSGAGALGAALAASPSELDVAAALADLDQEQAVLGLPRAAGRPRATGGTASWLTLTPLATAQLLSQLAGGLALPHYAAPPIGERVGSDAVTLVDQPGDVPFDDEGVPTKSTTIVRNGRLVELLSAGSARRRDWDAHTEVAPANVFLRPHATMALPDGVGLLVTRVTGVREAALDLRHTPLRLTLHGATLRGGEPAERVHGVVEASAQQILSGVVAVAGPVRFFRVAGVFGGAACLIDGLPVRLV